MRSTLLIAALLTAAAQAQVYPTRPIRMIVPSPPGGAPDILGRAVAQRMSEALGQQVVVDNRAGASGVIGTEMAAKAAPDGYTLILGGSTLYAMLPNLKKNLPYDVKRDFASITQIAGATNVLVVHPAVPAKSVAELITYAKANPGKLSFGSSGTGGLQHFAGEMVNYLGGIKMVHIPYKGGAAATADALAGNIQVGFGTLLSSRAYYKSGRLRPLGITARQRSSTAPEYPTLAEAGLPGYEVDQWYGIITSAKVPRPIVDKLAVAIAEGMKSPETAQRLSSEGSMPVGSTPDQFSAHIKSEIAKWRKLVKDAALVLHQ